MAQCGESEYVVTLDLRPARTASWTYRRAMAKIRNGRYVTIPGADPSVAVDLPKARTVLSFGVPVLDGWGTPGIVNAARAGISADSSGRRRIADRGHGRPVAARACRDRKTRSPRRWQAGCRRTPRLKPRGWRKWKSRELAEELKQNGPVLVLGSTRLAEAGSTVVSAAGDTLPADWQKAAPVSDLASLPDGSVRVLLIDESAPGEYLPWRADRKEAGADSPVVVAFAWSREGYARQAHYVLPVGVYPEVAGDIPAAIDSVAATFRISAPLVAPPAGIVNPRNIIASAAGLPIGDTLRERADAIHKAEAARCSPMPMANRPIRGVKADEFWKALNAGGCWMDAPGGKAVAAQLPAIPAAAIHPLEELNCRWG